MNIGYEVPNANEYVELIAAVGLHPRDGSIAAAVLSNSIFSVTIRDGNSKLIGMGRIIGDGGYHYQIVDVAVDPNHSGTDMLKVIMNEITDYLDLNAPKGAFVMIMAELSAIKLYNKYGFELTYPNSMSMGKSQ
ncbi:MAG: GNAT family N-acetyltransferase [Candidatus Pristimantibacillus sp.]